MGSIVALSRWFYRLAPVRHTGAAQASHLRDLENVRQCALKALDGCDCPISRRVRYQVRNAATVEKLWLLRTDIYQVLASDYCQFEAMKRINVLMPSFEGLLPARLLHYV